MFLQKTQFSFKNTRKTRISLQNLKNYIFATTISTTNRSPNNFSKKLNICKFDKQTFPQRNFESTAKQKIATLGFEMQMFFPGNAIFLLKTQKNGNFTSKSKNSDFKIENSTKRWNQKNFSKKVYCCKIGKLTFPQRIFWLSAKQKIATLGLTERIFFSNLHSEGLNTSSFSWFCENLNLRLRGDFGLYLRWFLRVQCD